MFCFLRNTDDYVSYYIHLKIHCIFSSQLRKMSPIRVSTFKMVFQQLSPFYTIVMPNNNNTLSLIDVGYDLHLIQGHRNTPGRGSK